MEPVSVEIQVLDLVQALKKLEGADVSGEGAGLHLNTLPVHGHPLLPHVKSDTHRSPQPHPQVNYGLIVGSARFLRDLSEGEGEHLLKL